MALDSKVSALTASLKSEFWKAWNQVADPAPWEEFTTIVPSTTRIENYVNSVPVPGLQLWSGSRNYQQVDTNVFQVRNQTWTTQLQAKLEDIEDDQTGILLQQPKFMVEKAKLFKGRMVLKMLGQALGATIALQNGILFNLLSLVDYPLPFFYNRTPATTPASFGYGTTQITFTAGSTDGKNYTMAAVYFGSPVLKPLCWQDRSGPDFQTNSGSEQSKENRTVRWWVDLRGTPFFSYWWNCVGVNIINTPNVAEMHALYSAVIAAFRSFQYPPTASTEDGEYIHEQSKFTDKTLCYITSTYLSEQQRQALNQGWIPQLIGTNSVATTNTWQGAAKTIESRFLDNF